MKRRIVVSFTAGLLAASGCGGKEPTIPGNPPPQNYTDPGSGDEGTEAPNSTETLEKGEPLELPESTDPQEIAPPTYTNPPPPGTGPDGRDIIPVAPPDLVPSRARPLPTWDDSKSPHPEGATNPPSPVLIVGEVDGACFKRWVSPFARSIESTTPHVETCTASPDSPHGNTCGAPIQCPPEAADILAAHKASKGAP